MSEDRGSVGLDGVAKRFGATVAVDGCGKTTTLRMLAGFEKADEGWIRVSGEYVQHVPPHNVAYGLRQRREDWRTVRCKVVEALDVVTMAPLANRKPRQLSGGQRLVLVDPAEEATPA